MTNSELKKENEKLIQEICYLKALVKDYEERMEYMKKHDCYIPF